jgi:hypothetical protein
LFLPPYPWIRERRRRRTRPQPYVPGSSLGDPLPLSEAIITKRPFARTPHNMTKPWAKNRKEIVRLYIREGRTLQEVKGIMKNMHNFDASCVLNPPTSIPPEGRRL